MIKVRNSSISDIYYQGNPIYRVYKETDLVYIKQESHNGPPSNPTILQLNQSIEDPTKMVTGTLGKDGNPKKHVVAWIRANSHRYVGTYNSSLGMVLKQLDDNNSEMYADGTSAASDITTKDVFMKMPTFWFRGEKLSTSYNIHFSAVEPNDGNEWVKWDGNTLIGVYEAVCQDTGNNANGELYSRSGITSTGGVSQGNFKAKARNRSNGDDHFMILTYEAHQVMALLYIAYYGDNMNAQTVIGAGTSSYPKVAGQTNVDGMNDTVVENSRSISFWGLENWWGDICEWNDNLITIDSRGSMNVLDYDGRPVRQITSVGTEGEISDMVLGKYLDMVPNKLTSSYTYDSYYCDWGRLASNINFVVRSSGYNSASNGGPFYFDCSSDSKYTYNNTGSRLLYHGRVTIDDSPSTKAIPERAKSVNTWRPIDLQYVYYNNRECLRTGMEFHICNLEDFSKLNSIQLSGLNINYEDIKFNTRDYEGIKVEVDYEGNITLIGNNTYDTISIDLEYEGNIIGTINLHHVTEEEVIEEDRKKHEEEMRVDNHE